MKVLDIRCGPGSITIDLARLVSQGHVTGVEYVPDPLEEARVLAAAKGVTNVSFEIGDIHSLPFEDDAFDVVHSHQVLQHISDPVNALQEMRRVTKVGGLVACRESASMTWYPQSDKLEKWKDITKTAGSWCFSNDEEREYWGGSMAQRLRSSGATLALKKGFSTREQLDEVAQGWDEFREDKDAWFGLLHGGILCRK
ncbi:hypothetical protein VE02_09934 [Pseudogymnoascus sp. 03VT05]|nr:hypothetical protein VE02_09934 [Pseudogymnoascus sp. 03VT05]